MKNWECWTPDGNPVVIIQANTPEQAGRLYVDWLDDTTRTRWIDVRYRLAGSQDEPETVLVTIDPQEPPCPEGGHEWARHRTRSTGPGLRISDRCDRCGLMRITRTWDHRPDTGEEGFQSVEFCKPEPEDSAE